MPTLKKRKQAETLRFSWNIPLGSVITGWWSGNGLGKYRTQETNQAQRHRALAGAPKRGDALTVPRSRRLIQREHHPRGAAGGSFQQAEGQVAAGPQQGEERSLWTRREGTGKRRAHLSERNEGRGLAYLSRKWLCLQRPPGLRFPEFPPGARTQPPPGAEVKRRYSRTTLTRISRHILAFERAGCYTELVDCIFTASPLGTNFVTPPPWSRNVSKPRALYCAILYFLQQTMH